MSYVYDEDGTLIAQTLTGGAQSSWGQSARYVYLPTASGPMPVAAIYGTKHYAIQSDHLNTPRRLIQSDGQVAWQWAYSAFGDEKPTTAKTRFANTDLNQSFGTSTVPAVTFNLRYPGQYFDQESNLHYNLNRSYCPGCGRYTQSDPIDLQGGWNRFSYVGQNPLSFTDSLGLANDDHSSGQWKQCTKGCRIRIDYKLVNGVKVRHLHWQCKKGEGVGGEYGGESHGETLDGAPAHIKECARRYGFEPDCPPEESVIDRIQRYLSPPIVYDPIFERPVPANSGIPRVPLIPWRFPPIYFVP